MNVRNLAFLLIGTFFINFNSCLIFACGLLDEASNIVKQVDEDINKAYLMIDQLGGKDAVKLACYLNGNLFVNLSSLSKYCNDIHQNINSLKFGEDLDDKNKRNKNTGIGVSVVDVLLKKVAGLEDLIGVDGKTRKFGSAENCYIKVLKNLEFKVDDFVKGYSNEIRSDENNRTKCDEFYRNYFKDYNLDDDNFNKIKDVLDKSQENLILALNKIDGYISKNPTWIKQVADCHGKKIEAQLEKLNKQKYLESKIDLVAKKLKYLLDFITEIIKFLDNKPKNTAETFNLFFYLDRLICAVADISYITKLDVVKNILEDFVFPESLINISNDKVYNIYKNINDVKLKLSFLREMVIKKLSKNFKYSECYGEVLNHSFCSLGIQKKLYTYSLNPYHLIWEGLGFTRDDFGLLEAKLRSMINSKKTSKNVKSEYGEKYELLPEITGLNFEVKSFMTVWNYQKNNNVLSGLPELVSAYIDGKGVKK